MQKKPHLIRLYKSRIFSTLLTFAYYLCNFAFHLMKILNTASYMFLLTQYSHCIDVYMMFFFLVCRRQVKCYKGLVNRPVSG